MLIPRMKLGLGLPVAKVGVLSAEDEETDFGAALVLEGDGILVGLDVIKVDDMILLVGLALLVGLILVGFALLIGLTLLVCFALLVGLTLLVCFTLPVGLALLVCFTLLDECERDLDDVVLECLRV